MILLASLEPILNPIWVFLINGEMPGPMAMLGGAIVLFAVLLRAFVGGGAPAPDSPSAPWASLAARKLTFA